MDKNYNSLSNEDALLNNNESSEVRALVNNIIKISSVDGPGNRLVIFFQGCNLDCLYCHNPETISMVDFCKDVKKYSVSELISEIKSVAPFIRGITVSGGEATLQSKFLVAFFCEVKKLGLSIFVDTNGTVPLYLDSLKEFHKLVDGYMLDVKSIDNLEHIKLTGKENDVLLKNLGFLLKSGKLYEVRTVMVQGFKYLDTIRGVTNIIRESEVIYKVIKYRTHGVRSELINNNIVPSSNFPENLTDEVKSLFQELKFSNYVIR